MNIRHATLHDGIDVAWVRARLPVVFGFEPAAAEVEKSLIGQAFLAVADDEAIAFECSDHYVRTSITYRDSESEPSKSAVAEAFWNLLLSEPDQLSDYQARVFHDGAGVWLEFGCDAGSPFCRESRS